MTQESQSGTEDLVRVVHLCMIFVSIPIIKSKGAGTAGHKSVAAEAKYPTGHQ